MTRTNSRQECNDTRMEGKHKDDSRARPQETQKRGLPQHAGHVQFQPDFVHVVVGLGGVVIR